MQVDQLDRYSRQILLPQIDIEGQRKLLNARVVIVGCGGLGSHVAMSLAGAGVGLITLIDFDRVELSNLHRQTYFTTQDVGEYKATSLQRRIAALNNDVTVTVVTERFETCNDRLDPVLLIDATDGYGVRVAINRYALSRQIAWVSAAAVAWQGHVVAFNGHSGCYECMYPSEPTKTITCEESGVVGPVLVEIAAKQALMALKIVLNLPVTYGQLTTVDFLRDTQHSLAVGCRSQCICSN